MTTMKKWTAPVVAAALAVTTMVPAFALAAGSDTPKAKSVKSVEFFGMAPAHTPQQKNELMYSEASVEVTYKDGTKKQIPLAYETLFRPGDVIGGKTTGVTTYADGSIITKADGAPYVSSAPDMNSLIRLPGMPANTYYLINQYESFPKNANGADNPASMQLSTIVVDPATGKMTVTAVRPIDFSEVNGLRSACAGVLSPWNTHLGSEETDPDARAHEANPAESSTTKFYRNYMKNDQAIGNPYHYGHVPEVSVDASGATKVVKHYSMGRMAFERVKVMPDNRTVVYGVDSNPGGFFIYVADRKNDLSAGTLYAAKWKQTGDMNGGSGDLSWIKLGHANDNEISQLANTLKFSDIFDATNDAAKGQAEGYVRVKTPANGKKDEWLKLKPGMDKAAAFLETHRYAAYVGATIEFNKMEGLDYNEKDNKGYLAISYLENTMTAEPGAWADDIRLPKLSAGGIYEINFAAGRKTVSGEKIDSRFVPVSMSGYLMGEDLAAPDAEGNTANVDKLANPDNVIYSDSIRTMFIAEDSSHHTNNVAWAYNIDTHKLSRIASVPDGGEATGLQLLDNVEGRAYLMLSSQNPAFVGYLSGIPALDVSKDKSGGNDDVQDDEDDQNNDGEHE